MGAEGADYKAPICVGTLGGAKLQRVGGFTIFGILQPPFGCLQGWTPEPFKSGWGIAPCGLPKSTPISWELQQT